jgi:hypothetical protein
MAACAIIFVAASEKRLRKWLLAKEAGDSGEKEAARPSSLASFLCRFDQLVHLGLLPVKIESRRFLIPH